ncbi:hypothetical protein CHUAL_012207 [Chamberlinius hualienensis]
MIPVDEGLYKKLAVLYPSLNEDDLRLICKKNYNNELAVMGDLSARGYRPVVGPGNDSRSMYTVIQSRNYTPLPYTGHISSTSMTTSTTTSTAMTTTTANASSSNGTSSSITAIKTINTDITKAHDKNPALIAAKVSSSSPTPALANSSTTDGCNSPQSYWCINTAKRTYSPIVGKMNPTRQTTNSPVVSHFQGEKQNGSNTTNTKSTGRYYYPGRFVQGVGFEPNSMGGAPRITGKPFVPLQGRYVFSGMINDRSYSPKLPQAKPPNTRDPNYGSGHQNHDLYQPTISPPPPPNPPPISLAVYAAYARQAEAAGFGNTNIGSISPHQQRSPAHSPYPSTTPSINYGSSYSYGHHHHINSTSPHVSTTANYAISSPRPYTGPIPSWYGEEDRVQMPVQRLHHDLIKNRITDRSASPPTSATILRTYSPVYGFRDRPTPSSSPIQQQQQQQQQTTSSSPYHHYYPPYSHHLVTTTTSASSFYATASRLYTQSPKPTLRSTTTPVVVPSNSASICHPQPYPHYHGPSTRPSPPPTAALVVTTSTPSNYNSPCHSPAFYPIRNSSPTFLQTVPQATGIPDGYPPYPAIRTSQTAGPHSPKIKLRYLRRIYPGVDETILLDVLANADNNVQTAMLELGQLGYVKIETPPIRPASATSAQTSTTQSSTQSTLLKAVDAFQSKPKPLDKDLNKPVAPPRRLTEADKQKRLLANLDNNRIPYGVTKPIVPARSSNKSMTDQIEKVEKGEYVFRSRYKSDVKGPNSYLRKGPNPELLQRDATSIIKTSSYGLSKGPNKDLLHSQSSDDNSVLSIPSVKDTICYNESSAEKIINRDSSPHLNKGPRHCLVQGSTYKIPS